MRPEILALFPVGVAGAEWTGDEAPPVAWPEERVAVAQAVTKRAREFDAGRHCARAALAELGVPSVALPMLPSGAPRWPDGILGSITHSHGYCGAVAARAGTILSLGFDAERCGAVAPAIWRDIASADELRALRARADDAAHLAALVSVLFSGKEAYYKAFHQLGGGTLDFHDVTLHLVDGGGFEVSHVHPPREGGTGAAVVRGRWRIDGAWVYTASAVCRP